MIKRVSPHGLTLFYWVNLTVYYTEVAARTISYLHGLAFKVLYLDDK